MNLVSKEGFIVGYERGAEYAPLEYMARCDPKTAIFPRGFRKLLVETCPMACFEWKQGRRVFGFRTQDILEENFNKGK